MLVRAILFFIVLLVGNSAWALNGAQISFLLSGLRTANGQPLSGGKVQFYDAGTTTPKAVYTDSTLTTPAANPVILDSNGIALVFAQGPYKAVVKTSADVTLYTWDNLYFERSQGTLPIADGGTGASTAASARTNLGLGTIATQAANSVTITGGSISGITDIAVADGGTGSSTASGARTNLGAAASGANSDITSLTGVGITGYITTPSAGSPMTVSSSTHIDGGYARLGRTVHWYSIFDVTFGGTGTAIAYATLPLTAGSITSGGFTAVIGNAALTTFYPNAVFMNSTGQVNIIRTDAAFTTGVSYRFMVKGTYTVP